MATLKPGSIAASSSLPGQEPKSYIKSFGLSDFGEKANISSYLLDDDRITSCRWKKESPEKWKKNKGNEVVELTKFLEKGGFMPNASHDGFFG